MGILDHAEKNWNRISGLARKHIAAYLEATRATLQKK
jgi:hypothetical protein